MRQHILGLLWVVVGCHNDSWYLRPRYVVFRLLVVNHFIAGQPSWKPLFIPNCCEIIKEKWKLRNVVEKAKPFNGSLGFPLEKTGCVTAQKRKTFVFSAGKQKKTKNKLPSFGRRRTIYFHFWSVYAKISILCWCAALVKSHFQPPASWMLESVFSRVWYNLNASRLSGTAPVAFLFFFWHNWNARWMLEIPLPVVCGGNLTQTHLLETSLTQSLHNHTTKVL